MGDRRPRRQGRPRPDGAGPRLVYRELGAWIEAAGLKTGKVFRRVSSAGTAWGDGVTEKLAWHVVKEFAEKTGVGKLAPHDLRRSCARLCRAAGGELEQIQFLLGVDANH